MNIPTELTSFITLSGYSSKPNMVQMANRHHEKWNERYSKWTYESAKQKLLSAYWTRIVPLHFFTVFATNNKDKNDFTDQVVQAEQRLFSIADSLRLAGEKKSGKKGRFH